MRRTLALHPDSRCKAVTRIEVEATEIQSGHLVLYYTVSGTIKDVRLPQLTVPARADELWRHTCFEAFVRPPHGEAYYELNFAPSTQWAAYRFSSYRNGMTVEGEIAAPRIQLLEGLDWYELRASLDLQRLGDIPKDSAWQLGLSAVIEETDGTISYWALAHPPGRADFHHSDCFALELARA